ncbi:MAG: hypothetical protein AAF685_02965 [Cyanobacteria bacterium P01_C01_bin.89]
MAMNHFLSAGIAALSTSLVALPALANPTADIETLDSVDAVSLDADALVFDIEEVSRFAATSIQPSEAPSDTAIEVAQRPFENSDGRRTSSKFSYIGVGFALGLSDDSDSELGDGGFALASKTGFTENISLHNLSVLGDDPVASFALTADFPIRSGDSPDSAIAAVPFAGAGIAIRNLFQDDSAAAFLLTGGVDVPLAYRWTATGRVAVGFFDETEAALVFGVGYTFTGFFK